MLVGSRKRKANASILCKTKVDGHSGAWHANVTIPRQMNASESSIHTEFAKNNNHLKWSDMWDFIGTIKWIWEKTKQIRDS